MDYEFQAYLSYLINNYTATALRDTVINNPCTITRPISEAPVHKMQVLITTATDKRYLSTAISTETELANRWLPSNKYWPKHLCLWSAHIFHTLLLWYMVSSSSSSELPIPGSNPVIITIHHLSYPTHIFPLSEIFNTHFRRFLYIKIKKNDLRGERVYPPTCPSVRDLVFVVKHYADFHDIWSTSLQETAAQVRVSWKSAQWQPHFTSGINVISILLYGSG